MVSARVGRVVKKKLILRMLGWQGCMHHGSSVHLLLLPGMRRLSAYTTVTEMGIRQTGTAKAVATWNTRLCRVSNGACLQFQPG